MTGFGAEVFILPPLFAWVLTVIYRLLKNPQGVTKRHRHMARPVSEYPFHNMNNTRGGSQDHVR